jgi:hypothetical protein
MSVTFVQGPAPDGGPTPQRVLKTNLSVLGVPLVTLFPAQALLIAGAAAHVTALKWLARPGGSGCAGGPLRRRSGACWRAVPRSSRGPGPWCRPANDAAAAAW